MLSEPVANEPATWRVTKPGVLSLVGTKLTVVYTPGTNCPFTCFQGSQPVGIRNFETLVAAKDALIQFRRDLQEMGMATD